MEEQKFQIVGSKISSEWGSSGSKGHIKEMKIADSIVLSLFMCSNVIVQHFLLATPQADIGFAGILYSNWLEMSPMIPKDQNIYNLHYDDVR